MRFARRNTDYQARHYFDLPPEARDRVYDDWSDVVYFCPECDEDHPNDYTLCPRYPAEHDDSGYMGTGTEYPEAVRKLARLMAHD